MLLLKTFGLYTLTELIVYIRELGEIFCAGVLDKVGIEPQVLRIGKYKSAGEQLTCRKMSEETCEMLFALLDNIYGDWLDKVSSAQGGVASDDFLFLKI